MKNKANKSVKIDQFSLTQKMATYLNVSEGKMKHTKLIFICFMSLLFFGCFIRIPTTSNEEMNKNVGKFGVINQDMILIKYYMSKSARNLEVKNNLKPEHFIRILKEGTRVKIKSVAYRRLPNGVFYYYVCEDIKNKDNFEIYSGDFDTINLEINR